MASGGARVGGIRIETDFAATLKMIKEFDRKLYTYLRANLRLAGQDTVREIRRVLAEPPPSGGGSSDYSDVRGALADGTIVSILAGTRVQGVRITTSGRNLPERHQAMTKAYNRKSWVRTIRHSGVRVQQEGNPYFGKVITEGHAERFRKAVDTALGEAVVASSTRGE